MIKRGYHFTLLFFLLVVVLTSTSCVKYKTLVLMDENQKVLDGILSHQVVREDSLHDFQAYRIRPYDQLMIRINAFDGSTEEFLNREFSDELTQSGGNAQFDPASLYFNSYTVDGSGFVILPIIERVEVNGMTLTDLKIKLDSSYLPYLKFASSNVKLANMRVTVLGEVGNPGLHYLYNEKNTILDALSLAGNISPFANLGKVKMIRLTEKGSKTVYIDMTSSDFVYSEYYFVRPYDVIYLEPVKAKALDSSSESVGIVLSVVSIIVFLANIFIN